MGLEYIVKGDTIKIDVTKVLIDHEEEEQIYDTCAKDTTATIEDYLRFKIINSSFCLCSNVARNAVPMKPYIGKEAYTIQSVVEMLKKRTETFDVYVDSESWHQNDSVNHTNT